jgi:subtilisin family serine protease
MPSDYQQFDESSYWYPDELAVTVQASSPPTLRQLRDLSKRLQHLLSKQGINVRPFYAGGQCVSRGPRQPGGWLPVTLSNPHTPDDMEEGDQSLPTVQVEKHLHDSWLVEVGRCTAGTHKRFPGVHFFGEGLQGHAVILYALHPRHRHTDPQQDVVRIAVNFINQHRQHLAPHRPQEKLPVWKEGRRKIDDYYKEVNQEDHHNPNPHHQQRLRVLAAMPNWAHAPSQWGMIPPSGPGAPPLAAPAPTEGRWVFAAARFEQLRKQTATSTRSVHVIILDTGYAKDQADLQGQTQTMSQRVETFFKSQPHPLLATIRDGLRPGGHLTIKTKAATADARFRAGLDEYARPYSYNMVDHGIFVLGIIEGILPTSPTRTIEWMRIQNDYGSGELDLFLGALTEIGQRPKTELEHTVLNLSLGVLPPLERLQEVWFGSDCSCEGIGTDSLSETLDLLHLGIRLPIQALVDQGVVIVAAAGNDSMGQDPAFGPRIPARYDGVLAVAAVDRIDPDGTCEAADYSNRANIHDIGTGIATYGGEQPNHDSETLARLALAGPLTAPDDIPDAVRGLYLYDTFPPSNADETKAPTPNTTGWAWWSGTSFATPVVSALAAHYILDGKSGQEVIQALLNDLAAAGAPYERRLQGHVLEVRQF